MPETDKRPLKVFLCHAHSDKDAVRTLYSRLTKDGVDAWLDKEKLLPGQDWELEIRKAVREADVVVVCLSKQFNQAGFRQKEVRLALDTAMEKPEGEIFIIPTRLEECDNLESLRKWHWVDLFEDDGYSRLLKSLSTTAAKLGAVVFNVTNLVGIGTEIGERTDNLTISALESKWELDLSEEQKKAVSHFGSHARVLAGPGTGKTLVLTRRIEYLIDVKGVNPNQILALTFTRAAAGELAKRVASALGDENTPRISTLHSFALKQLLRNSRKIISLPQPLRIADDWEEANIIFPDIKRLLKLSKIKLAKELFDSLASDWESLVPEENLTPDPKFIANWKTHRKIFGYTLRSELVYQLKRSIEQIPDFELEHPLRYLLVDEYQDLNKCELAVIKAIEDQSSVEVYIAGDDDQSIYLFRKAHPEGIRSFHKDFEDVQDIPLTICKRCDSSILDIAEFVASLDDERLPKKIYPEPGRNAGEVKLLAFTNQFSEAEGIARICKHLIEKKNISPEQILILLRSDSNGVFSREIVEAFGKEIPISISKKEGNIFDTTFGRQLIAIFRLLRNREDHLSWRTLIQIRTKNSLGEKAQSDLYDLARENNISYYGVIIAAIDNSIQVGFRDRLLIEYELISSLINSVDEVVNSGQNPLLQVKQITDFVLPEEYRQPMIQFFMELIEKEKPSSISDLIGKLESSQINDWNVEQEIEKGKVNVLTMHRAKGLTADIVFIVGAEDQLIPGSNDKEPELGDERRLLFVSLTRAKHKLYITYCKDRTGAQQYSGRNPGTSRHNLTQFLTDSPLHPVSGEKYTSSLNI